MRSYPAANHNIVKALERAKIQFPISKAELMKRMRGVSIRVGWDREIPFTEYCEKIVIGEFETKGQFFCALAASLGDLEQIIL